MTPPNLIDFFGPPGAGKSSIAAELAHELSSLRVPISEPTYELSHNIGRWKSHLYKLPRSISGLKDSQVHLPKGNFIHEPFGTIRSLYNWLFISDIVLESPENAITILDQGIIQAAWSYGYLTNSRINSSIVDLGLDIIPEGQKYLAVYVTAPAEDIYNRLNERSVGTQPDEFTEEITGLKQGVRSFEKLYSLVESVVDTQSNKSVISIDNSGKTTPQQCAKSISLQLNDGQNL